MKKNSTDDKLSKIAKLCQEAVDQQKQRESKLGYGLDDYTEGRIVGTANLARKILREIKEEA
jgi:hypothetical protein